MKNKHYVSLSLCVLSLASCFFLFSFGCAQKYVESTTSTTTTTEASTTTTVTPTTTSTVASTTSTTVTSTTTTTAGSTTTTTAGSTTTTVTSTSTTTTTFALGGARYCFTNGTPEAFASPEAHFIGCYVQNTNALSDGTASPETVGWAYCYYGITFEVILVNRDASLIGRLFGPPYETAYSDFASSLNRTVEVWNIDSTTAKNIADHCATVEAWLIGKDPSAFNYQYKLNAPAGGIGLWRIVYGEAPGSDCTVLISAATGNIISATTTP
ncbi:MAG: hypothetical protein WC890_05545 [Candidatus Margulisiibacteriota bacterium]